MLKQNRLCVCSVEEVRSCNYFKTANGRRRDAIYGIRGCLLQNRYEYVYYKGLFSTLSLQLTRKAPRLDKNKRLYIT